MGRSHILIDLDKHWQYRLIEGINLLVGRPCCRQSRCNNHDRFCSQLAPPQYYLQLQRKNHVRFWSITRWILSCILGVLPDAHFLVHIGHGEGTSNYRLRSLQSRFTLIYCTLALRIQHTHDIFCN